MAKKDGNAFLVYLIGLALADAWNLEEGQSCDKRSNSR